MKFQFDDQPHQAAAVAAVTDLFEGALPPLGALSTGHGGVEMDLDVLVANLTQISEREGVERQTTLKLLTVEDLLDQPRSFANFSVEMETGTGKTFVYIATALRMAELYGLRKFVILVHSVAIRAGVIKTFEQTKDFFGRRHPGLQYGWGALGDGPAIDDFTSPSTAVQFLIVSIQAIDKPKTNSIYQSPEQPQLWTEPSTDIAAIAAARPVLIIDEPQNFTTTLRRRAVATLNPLFALRYSATHKEPYNLVHRLGARAASEAGLVKRVAVKGVVAGGGGPYIRLEGVEPRRRRLTASAVIDRRTRSGVERGTVVIHPGTDLHSESGGIDGYRGWVVEEIRRRPDQVMFTNGRTAAAGQELGVDRLAIWRDQVRHVIRQHLARQAQIDSAGRHIKVLSLFFVERVADYVGPNAVLPALFDELFREEWQRAGGPVQECPDPAKIRVHYFPSTKTGLLKDTSGRANEADFEARAYQEIVAHKELLLERSNPRAFIFSHSALREGWDNPNVFQIGFLRHSRSEVERRQQIGRGLRLPVNQEGRRVPDPVICRLTLVVDETFAEFRDGLNLEYEADGTPRSDRPAPPDDADEEVVVRRRRQRFESPEFAELWRRIRHKARYRVSFVPDALPPAVAASEILQNALYIAPRANIVQMAELEYDDEGRVITPDEVVVEGQGEAISIAGLVLPNVVKLVEDHLLTSKYPMQFTRSTLCAVVEALPDDIKARSAYDPERWSRIVAETIRIVAVEQLVDQIVYEPVPEEEWWDAEAVLLEVEPASPAGGPGSGIGPAPAGGANLYDHLVYDSDVERLFAGRLENDGDHIPLFTKLPRRFKIRTPVGDYSPDWAIVYDRTAAQRLILVRETKDVLDLHDLPWDEQMRIRFAKRHFEARADAPVDFVNATDQSGLRIAQPLT